MAFWHLNICVLNKCLFGITLQHLLIYISWERQSHWQTSDSENEKADDFYAQTELFMAGAHSYVLSGALHFQSWEKPYPYLEKVFILFLLFWCHYCCYGEKVSAAWQCWKNQHWRISVQRIVHFMAWFFVFLGFFLLLLFCFWYRLAKNCQNYTKKEMFLCANYLDICKFCEGVPK